MWTGCSCSPDRWAGLRPLVQSVTVQIEHWTRDPGVGHVRVIHNRREGRSRAVPVTRDLLPIPDAYLEGPRP